MERRELHENLFTFEKHSWTWNPNGCLASQEKHYAEAAKWSLDWHVPTLKYAFQNMHPVYVDENSGRKKRMLELGSIMRSFQPVQKNKAVGRGSKNHVILRVSSA